METNFGVWLKSQIDSKNISQKELADMSGVTPAQISRVIGGSRGIGTDALVKIAHALKLPEETVFQAAGIMKPTYDPNLDKDPSLLEWIKIYKDADTETRERMIDNARYFSNRGTQKR